MALQRLITFAAVDDQPGACAPLLHALGQYSSSDSSTIAQIHGCGMAMHELQVFRGCCEISSHGGMSACRCQMPRSAACDAAAAALEPCRTRAAGRCSVRDACAADVHGPTIIAQADDPAHDEIHTRRVPGVRAWAARHQAKQQQCVADSASASVLIRTRLAGLLHLSPGLLHRLFGLLHHALPITTHDRQVIK